MQNRILPIWKNPVFLIICANRTCFSQISVLESLCSNCVKIAIRKKIASSAGPFLVMTVCILSLLLPRRGVAISYVKGTTRKEIASSG
ncbi:MAG: hypothetical protein GYA26_01815 [Flexilinea flocculi]|nr:hypothetical protein [Flexilinea flocculi]